MPGSTTELAAVVINQMKGLVVKHVIRTQQANMFYPAYF
jgi:hypothetical protein